MSVVQKNKPSPACTKGRLVKNIVKPVKQLYHKDSPTTDLIQVFEQDQHQWQALPQLLIQHLLWA